MSWKLVPEVPDEEMIAVAQRAGYPGHDALEIYLAMLSVAPQPEHDSMTKEEARAFNNWKGVDGSIAFHLIERHADGWNQVGMMMNAWLEANKT